MQLGDKHAFNPQLRIAIIHDWIFERRGGEKVLERILHLFPQSHLYYLFGKPKKILKLKHKQIFFSSFLNKIPFISKFYKTLLPFFPMAIESFDLTNYDLIISTSSCVAKGIIPPPQSKHISYIHSPMRYAWDQEHRYFKKKPTLFRPFEIIRRILLNYLRVWDVTSSVRVDKLIANSHFVARRCELYYGKKAEVIYPPVDTTHFKKNEPVLRGQSSKKVLLFGAWVPYKKMLDALSLLVKNNISVIAAGNGEELHKAFKQFRGKVEFFFSPTDEEIPIIFAKAHVLLFPAIEDFGIVPLEATANGLWVVAPNIGGTKETVLNNRTGFTFQEGDPHNMIQAVKKALAKEILPEDLEKMTTQVAQFSPQIFDEKLLNTIQMTLANQLE